MSRRQIKPWQRRRPQRNALCATAKPLPQRAQSLATVGTTTTATAFPFSLLAHVCTFINYSANPARRAISRGSDKHDP